MDRVIFWDFDGTLAYRPGRWGSALLHAAQDLAPDLGVTIDDLRPLLHNGFPWHTPEVAHPELSEREAWWDALEPVLARAFRGVGAPEELVRPMAAGARLRYTDPTSYFLYDDTLAALDRLSAAGWEHGILSNHVPELSEIIAGVGLGNRFQWIVNSAETGFEKPHPEAYAVARAAAGEPREVLMIGDNPRADVVGAERAGIPAWLVARDGGPGADSLLDIADAIENGE